MFISPLRSRPAPFVGALLLTLAGLLGVAARAANAAIVAARGPVTSLDLEKRTVEVEIGGGASIKVRVAATTKIVRNGKPAKLGRLTLLDRVRLRYQTTDGVALGVVANGPDGIVQVAGAPSAIAFGEAELTIAGRRVHATAATRIARNGEDASLSEITRDDRLVAHLRQGSDDALDLLASGPSNDEIHGTIVAIGSSSIEIAPENGTANLALTLDAETLFEIDGRTVARSALAAGQAVEAHFHPVSRLAFSVEADSGDAGEDAHLLGTVAAVDVAAGSITALPGGGGSALTFEVAPTTEIEVDGETAGLDEIAAGMPVNVEYYLGSFVAKEIKAGDDTTDDVGDEDVHATGVIEAIDLGGSRVTLSVGGASLVLGVAATTEIEIDGETATLDDLQAGDTAAVEYLVGSLVAKEIKVGASAGSGGGGGNGGNGGGGNGPGEDAEVVGSVAAVDVSGATVTIAATGGTSVTVKITAATQIEIDGEPGTLANVAVGAAARAEYLLDTLEAKELEVGQDTSGGGNGGNGGGNGGGTGPGEDAEVIGSLAAVGGGAGSSSVTIAPTGGGAAITLEVNAATKIEIDGEDATYAQLASQTGRDVRAEYDVDSKIASEIEVGADD